MNKNIDQDVINDFGEEWDTYDQSKLNLKLDEAYFQSTTPSPLISIYHYHGTCKNLVDSQQRVNGKTNLFIGDISVLSKPWGGSTSFPALVTGYIASKYI